MRARRTSAVLVGRDAELRALEEAIAERAERPVVLVGGEAGTGKTRLVRETLERAAAAGSTVATGSCVELGADLLPYAPFVESLGRLVEDAAGRTADLLGTAGADLASLVPDLLDAGGAAVAGARDGAATAGGGTTAGGVSRGRMYEAVRAVLDRAPEPFLLVLEDLHWADRSTLELLDYLVRRLRQGRTLILGTYRTDDLHRRHPLPPVLAELERTGRAARVDLRPLDRAAVGQLLGELGVDADPSMADAVARRSGGNPFLVEELVAAGVSAGAPLPASLRDLLLARIGAVEQATRQVLGIVAAIGRPADAELVELAWDGSADQLDGALRDAIDRGLLVVEAADGRRLAFRHALVAEAMVDDLLPGERVRLHERLARILAGRPDLASATPAGAAAELAHHLWAGRDLPAALGAAVRAADAAVSSRAYPEARDLYERALDLFERVPDARAVAGIDRVALLDRAAEASFHAGDVPRAVALGRAALAEADDEADPWRTGWLLCRLIEWAEEAGEVAELASLAERAVTLVPAEPPSRERAFALIGVASAAMHRSRSRQQLLAAAEAARVAAACGATGCEAIARSVAATALMGLARDGEAEAEAERAGALAATSRGTEEVVIVTLNRLTVAAFPGHYARLAEMLPEAREAVDREGSAILCEPYFGAWEAAILAWEGHTQDAEAVVSRIVERDGVAPSTRADLLCLRGRLRVRRGLPEDGERDLRAALRFESAGFAESIAEVHAALAEAALLRDDPRGALAAVADGLAVLEPTDDISRRAALHAVGLRAAADLAERSRARRDRDGAGEAQLARDRHLDRLQAALGGRLVEEGGVNDLVRAMGAWGLAEASRGAGEPTPDRWAEAATRLPAVGETHLAAYCRYREAEAALAGPGDRSRAVAALRAARAWAVTAGAEPLRRDVDALARRARIDLAEPAPPATLAAAPPPATAPSDRYGLSPRELEVLAMLVDGRTNREIGEALFITEKTASVHVSHILDKLGVTSRGAAAALAARAGLV